MKAGNPLGDYVERMRCFTVSKRDLIASLTRFLKSNEPRSSSHHLEQVNHQTFPWWTKHSSLTSINDEGRYLLVVPSGWTMQQLLKARPSTADFSEKERGIGFSRQYPSVAKHLKTFIEPFVSDKTRRLLVDFRPCDYYEYLDCTENHFPGHLQRAAVLSRPLRHLHR